MTQFGLFLDESGHANPTSIDPNNPLLVVCGVLFARKDYPAYRDAARALKRRYFATDQVVFHSRDIRKRTKPFNILLDPARNAAFINDINVLFMKHTFTVLSAVIDKQAYFQKYPLSRADVYKIALEFIMERAMYHVGPKGEEQGTIKIIAESRGSNEDAPLLAAYNRILDTGNRFNLPDRFRATFKAFEFKRKRELIDGLELADLCAYPIARHMLDPVKSHPSYQLVQQKLLRREGSMVVDGYGLKRFP